LFPAWAAPTHKYDNGFAQTRKIGSDLYQTLDPKFQKSIFPEPVQIEQMETPLITPVEGEDENKSLREVKISVGFIDLINHLAHAKAIDHIQSGYFQKYLANLAAATENEAGPEPVEEKYWSDDVMNDQASYFNQMMGITVSLALTHHYLGHYNQFSSQMFASKLVPIDTLITPAEWEATVKAATLNALNTAFGTDGAKALFEAIDKLKTKPNWVAFIVPPTTDLKKLNKELKKYEDDFFKGGLK
jgi:hypothetical protein